MFSHFFHLNPSFTWLALLLAALCLQRVWLRYRQGRKEMPLSPLQTPGVAGIPFGLMGMPEFTGMAQEFAEMPVLAGAAVIDGQQYQALIDRVSAVIYVTDWEGRIGYVSPSVAGLTGYTATDLAGRRYVFLVDPDMLPMVSSHYIHQREIRLSETTLEFCIITRSGERKWVEQTALLLIKDDKVEGYQCFVRDITEKKKMQDEHHRQLMAAKNEAEDARKLQEQFLANMSHEIRTPMNGIQGMTNLLLETDLSLQQREFADVISRSAANLLVIINDILDISKIKAGKLAIEKIDFRLDDILSNIHSLFEPRVRKKGISFTIDKDPNIPEWLQGDPYRLNQVLINLVGNAVKFTEKGSIRVMIASEAVQTLPDVRPAGELRPAADTRQAGERPASEIGLVFTVTDTGAGIPEKSLPHLFNSFSQAGLDITRRYGGTGLGLAICHQLLELQKGRIHVTSREGMGSQFVFSLPYGITRTNKPADAVVVRPISDYGAFLDGKQFLVVEDNPVNQKLVEYVLQKVGASVTLAENGKEAIGILENRHFDLIIMDLQMPEMDGYEATRYLRTQLRLQTPVMAMTANAIQGERLRCMEAGMNDYMSKPFDFHDFYAHLSDLLAREPRAAVYTPSAPPAGYSLSLLEEVGDEGYLRDILQTLLTTVPDQLCQLRQSLKAGDHESIYQTAHKLTGSCGMIKAVSLTEKLATLGRLAKEREDCSLLIYDVIRQFNKLLGQLKNDPTLANQSLAASTRGFSS